jgi:hypothetical protein
MVVHIGSFLFQGVVTTWSLFRNSNAGQTGINLDGAETMLVTVCLIFWFGRPTPVLACIVARLKLASVDKILVEDSNPWNEEF